MNSNSIHKKKVVSVREKRLRGNAAFHVIAKMMRGWVYGDKLHINVGGKKIQFGYTWLSPIMCSNPFLLKASHVYFFTVKHGGFFFFFSSHFKKVFFWSIVHLRMDVNFH